MDPRPSLSRLLTPKRSFTVIHRRLVGPPSIGPDGGPTSEFSTTARTSPWMMSHEPYRNTSAPCERVITVRARRISCIGNDNVPKSMINSTINNFFNCNQRTLVISNRNSFRVLSDKIASVYFIWKICLYFCTGNGQPREPALCQLYRHTSVPYGLSASVASKVPRVSCDYRWDQCCRLTTCWRFGRYRPQRCADSEISRDGENSKCDATRCQILRIKCTKFDFRWGSSAAGPSGEAHTANHLTGTDKQNSTGKYR